jgi:hypothetical protein
MTATLIKEVWDLMGPKLRRVVVVAVILAFSLFVVTVTLLAWSAGIIQERLGLMPTASQFEERTGEITDNMATKQDVAEVASALYNYQDSLGRLRAHLDTTLISPGLMAIVDLQRRMGRFESGQVETRLAIEEQKRASQQGTVQLIAQMNRMSSSEERDKMDKERQDNEREARQTAMLEALLRKNKINPEIFDTR